MNLLPGSWRVPGYEHQHTWDTPGWPVDELIAAKGERTVSVVIPALNEAATVAGVVHSIVPLVGTLVDELIVLDSGSTDETAARARAAGARVVSREAAVPDVEVKPGKGEVLWRSLAVATGTVIVFVDADLVDPDPEFVPKLLGPVLTVPEIRLVKGYYRRPLRRGTQLDDNGGGRVTELVARPLLAALRPELGVIVQPLGGEYAATRDLMVSVPFAPGYGVEIGLLIDTFDRHGIDAIGQVNLGVRTHRNRSLHELGVMSRQIVGTILGRCGIKDSGAALAQFPLVEGRFVAQATDVALADRPAMNTLGE